MYVTMQNIKSKLFKLFVIMFTFYFVMLVARFLLHSKYLFFFFVAIVYFKNVVVKHL